MTSPLRRCACAPLALLLSIAGCATTTEPAGSVGSAGVSSANPQPQNVSAPGIPDWVRTIHDSPTLIDRKGFAPGDLVPVVAGSSAVIANEVLPIRYAITEPDGTYTNDPAALFDRAQTTFKIDADHVGKAFSFVLRVKQYADIKRGRYTVKVFIDGTDAAGNPVQMPDSKTHEFHINS